MLSHPGGGVSKREQDRCGACAGLQQSGAAAYGYTGAGAWGVLQRRPSAAYQQEGHGVRSGSSGQRSLIDAVRHRVRNSASVQSRVSVHKPGQKIVYLSAEISDCVGSVQLLQSQCLALTC